MIRSATPGRAMTSCGNASTDLISRKARKRSASYIIATASASAIRSCAFVGCGSGRRVEQGDPPPIELHRVSIPGRHSRLSRGVVCERELKRVIQVLSYDVYCADGMHKAHRDSASTGGVCAGTRVAHTDDPRCDGNAVHDKTPVAVDDAPPWAARL
jgi:hypothetical protein